MTKQMTPSQQRAVQHLKAFIERHEVNKNPEYQDQITEWETELTEHGTLILRARTEMLGLPETNLLRFVSSTFFLFFIGRGGKIVMAMGPKHYEQFNRKGRTSFGFTVEI